MALPLLAALAVTPAGATCTAVALSRRPRTVAEGREIGAGCRNATLLRPHLIDGPLDWGASLQPLSERRKMPRNHRPDARAASADAARILSAPARHTVGEGGRPVLPNSPSQSLRLRCDGPGTSSAKVEPTIQRFRAGTGKFWRRRFCAGAGQIAPPLGSLQPLSARRRDIARARHCGRSAVP